MSLLELIAIVTVVLTVVMMYAGFYTWSAGRENKSHERARDALREEFALQLRIVRSDIALEIQKAEERTRHQMRNEITAKILELGTAMREELRRRP